MFSTHGTSNAFVWTKRNVFLFLVTWGAVSDARGVLTKTFLARIYERKRPKNILGDTKHERKTLSIGGGVVYVFLRAFGFMLGFWQWEHKLGPGPLPWGENKVQWLSFLRFCKRRRFVFELITATATILHILLSILTKLPESALQFDRGYVTVTKVVRLKRCHVQTTALSLPKDLSQYESIASVELEVYE